MLPVAFSSAASDKEAAGEIDHFYRTMNNVVIVTKSNHQSRWLKTNISQSTAVIFFSDSPLSRTIRTLFIIFTALGSSYFYFIFSVSSTFVLTVADLKVYLMICLANVTMYPCTLLFSVHSLFHMFTH